MPEYGYSGHGDGGYGTDGVYEYSSGHGFSLGSYFLSKVGEIKKRNGFGFSRGSYSSPKIERITAPNVLGFSRGSYSSPEIERTTIPFNTYRYGEGGYGDGGYGIDTTFAIASANVMERAGTGIENVSSNAIANGVSFLPRTGKGIENEVIGTAITNSISSPKIGTVTNTGTAISIPPVLNPELVVTVDRSVLDENYGAFINELNMKQGDTHPPVRAELYGLTNKHFYYADISIVIEHIGNNEIVVTDTIDERDLVTDEVVYHWTQDGSDLPYIGKYRVEFEITHPDGRTETFPPNEYLEFEVTEELN